jgi:uncharacterized membrane protein YagU involved in acid resistance
MTTATVTPTTSDLPRNLLLGTAAGLVGGIVFGLMMTMMGMIGMIGALAGQLGNVPVSWVIHLVISAIIGAGFGLVAPYAGATLGRVLGVGAVYGLVWWFLGPLLIMPMMMGMGPQLSAAGMSGAIPSLVGHILFGLVTAYTWHWLGRRQG